MIVANQSGTTLSEARGDLVEDSRRRFRETRHDVTTNKGVVSFLNEAINAFVLSPDGDIIGREELNTLGYVCGVQLKAIQAVQSEEKPGDSITDLLGNGVNVEIRMTKEERKMFLTAGTVDNMARVLEQVKNDGRIVELEPQADGSFSVPPMSEPPKRETRMPAGELVEAFGSEGIDITRDEVKALLGPSLGTVPSGDDSEIEAFGFEDIYTQTPATEPGLAHAFETVSYPHPQLDGVVVRVSKCTKCGITTRNTKTIEHELCGSDI